MFRLAYARFLGSPGGALVWRAIGDLVRDVYGDLVKCYRNPW